jgi:hypothetical protein
MELRHYQDECLKCIRTRYRKGARRLLVSLPTGTGKTVVFAAMPRFFELKKRMLVLAHRWCGVVTKPRHGTPRMPEPMTDKFAAIRTIDNLVRRYRTDCLPFLAVDAGWRAQLPTEKQMGILRRLGIPPPEGLTRGQASWMIAMHGGSRT